MSTTRPPSRACPIVLLLAFLASNDCGAPTTPTPSPSPTYPRGIANATIFENIPLIRQLEASFARDSSLVFMGGAATQDGRVSPGSSWRYQFGYTTDRFRVVQWSVLPDGTIEYDGDTLGLNVTSTREIGPALVHDSPELARLARSYGARPMSIAFPARALATRIAIASARPKATRTSSTPESLPARSRST